MCLAFTKVHKLSSNLSCVKKHSSNLQIKYLEKYWGYIIYFLLIWYNLSYSLAITNTIKMQTNTFKNCKEAIFGKNILSSVIKHNLFLIKSNNCSPYHSQHIHKLISNRKASSPSPWPSCHINLYWKFLNALI